MRILIFGDSIAAGMFDQKGGWATRLRILTNSKHLKNLKYDRVFYNLSVSGNSTKELLERVKNEINARMNGEELVIIFAIGENDSWVTGANQIVNVTEKVFKNNLQLLVNLAKLYSEKIFFIGLTPVEEKKVNPVPWRPEISYFNSQIALYDSIIKKICQDNDVDFIDIWSEFNKKNYKLLLSDGLHPNTKGHEVIYEKIRDCLIAKKII